MSKKVAVVDLFAGPGGLGEGFARHDRGPIRFDVCLSVEKDMTACRTLQLRKFFRQFSATKYRRAYYSYVQGKGSHPSEVFSQEWAAVEKSVLPWELGSAALDQKALEKRIKAATASASSWILVGGPPCQAYSLVGRSRMMGQDPIRFLRDHRHTLYLEYLKVLAKFAPPVFVMENVKGVLSSRLGDRTAFEQICNDLRAPHTALGHPKGPEYTVLPIVRYGPGSLLPSSPAPQDFVVRSERHGIPQARHRVILIGLRTDVAHAGPLRPLDMVARPATVGSVIDDLPRLRSRLSREADSLASWQSVLREAAEACVTQGVSCPSIRSLLAPQAVQSSDIGAPFQAWRRKPANLPEWFHDPNLKGVLNHESRSHIRMDLHRYMFVSAYAEVYDRSPSLNDFPSALLPHHQNAATANTGRLVPFADRFRVQRRNHPATTVTSHISRDGHYFIHPDPTQCRSLSVREAARLQTFPDNYYFEGNRTQQYHQVGNAVPPYLALQIAERIAEFLQSMSPAKR